MIDTFKCVCIAMLFTFGILPTGVAPLCHSGPIIVEKNLFSSDRKPPGVEPASADKMQKPSVPPNTLQLDGIMVRGSSRKALIRIKGPMPEMAAKKNPSPFLVVREGERIRDYLVSRIDMKSITVEKDGQCFELHLYANNKVLPPMPPSLSSEQSTNEGTHARSPGSSAPSGRPPQSMNDGAGASTGNVQSGDGNQSHNTTHQGGSPPAYGERTGEAPFLAEGMREEVLDPPPQGRPPESEEDLESEIAQEESSM